MGWLQPGPQGHAVGYSPDPQGHGLEVLRTTGKTKAMKYGPMRSSTLLNDQ